MPSPDQIGRYRLERPLGSGAFGMVWLAHDDSLEAPVAVKVMAENWAYRLDLRERFLTEARMLRRAASSGVVQIFDIGELPDERPYFVMEYADGGTLADRLDGDAPLPVAEALRLAAEAARAVASLHEAGIVHRDIKPSNVLIRATPGGRDQLLVADLGLAKSLAQASGLTMAAGSAGYMSPEQAEPGCGIDVRADVYGLGALAYHLVTGSVPGPPGRVVPPRKLRPELPNAVQRAIMRALESDRERRWPVAADFAAELERLADGRATAPGRPPRRRARRAVVTAFAAGAAVAVAAAVAVTALATRHSSPPVRVSNATGRIAVEVPASWSGQLRGGGWDPKTALGLPDTRGPGLAVSADLRTWQDLSAGVNGVFVGLSEHGDLAARVRTVAHPDCRYRGSRAYANGSWHGQVRRWSDCAGGASSIEEVGLVRPKGGQPQVYVQIRQVGDGDAADRILDSLRIGRGTPGGPSAAGGSDAG